MTDEQIKAWNDCVARGNEDEIHAMQAELIREMNAKVMNEDPNYATAGWTAK